MTRSTSLATVALLMAAAGVPALAASSASSAASDSIGESVGSISTSVQKSSNSSSGKDDKVSEGDYRIVEVAAAPARPATVRLKLQAVVDTGKGAAKDEEFFLYMPQEAYDQSHLAPGQVVTARQRNYGLEFMRSENQQAFFLVLDDQIYRELQTKVVQL